MVVAGREGISTWLSRRSRGLLGLAEDRRFRCRIEAALNISSEETVARPVPIEVVSSIVVMPRSLSSSASALANENLLQKWHLLCVRYRKRKFTYGESSESTSRT